MSATILYTPVSTRRVVKGGGTSAWEKVRQIWGERPHLRESDLPTLRALAVADMGYGDFWGDLARLVEQHGAIDLDAEY